MRMMQGEPGMALGVPDQEDFRPHLPVYLTSTRNSADRRRSFWVSPDRLGKSNRSVRRRIVAGSTTPV
jgi:hypothetical protein